MIQIQQDNTTSLAKLDAMLDAGTAAINKLIEAQRRVLG